MEIIYAKDIDDFISGKFNHYEEAIVLGKGPTFKPIESQKDNVWYIYIYIYTCFFLFFFIHKFGLWAFQDGAQGGAQAGASPGGSPGGSPVGSPVGRVDGGPAFGGPHRLVYIYIYIYILELAYRFKAI